MQRSTYLVTRTRFVEVSLKDDGVQTPFGAYAKVLVKHEMR